MRRIYSFLLLALVSVFILSANKFTCYNADLLGGWSEGEDPFAKTSIKYIARDTGESVPTTGLTVSDAYLIATDMNTKKKIIKNASRTVGYSQLDDEESFIGDPVGWTVFNVEYFLNTYIPAYYPGDEERLREWLDPSPIKPQGEYFIEPVVLHSEDAILTSDPWDPNQVHVVSQSFYMNLRDEDGSGPELILETEDLPIYDYDKIIEADAPEETSVDFRNTVRVNQQVPNR